MQGTEFENFLSCTMYMTFKFLINILILLVLRGPKCHFRQNHILKFRFPIGNLSPFRNYKYRKVHLTDTVTKFCQHIKKDVFIENKRHEILIISSH